MGLQLKLEWRWLMSGVGVNDLWCAASGQCHTRTARLESQLGSYFVADPSYCGPARACPVLLQAGSAEHRQRRRATPLASRRRQVPLQKATFMHPCVTILYDTWERGWSITSQPFLPRQPVNPAQQAWWASRPAPWSASLSKEAPPCYCRVGRPDQPLNAIPSAVSPEDGITCVQLSPRSGAGQKGRACLYRRLG